MSLKLVYLSCEAPSLGGASHTHIYEILKGFEKRGWQTKLYIPSYSHGKEKPNLFFRLFESIKIQIKLWAGWQKGSIIYVRAHYLAFPTAVIAKIFGIPIFHEINGPYEDTFVTYPSLNKLKPILIFMQKFQYRSATGSIAVTKELREWVDYQSLSRPSLWVSNAANTDLFSPKTKANQNLPDKYVVFFGSLAKWHGIDVMLDAVNSESWPQDLFLIILGDGALRSKIESASKLNKNIIYYGPTAYDVLPSFICKAVAGLVPITSPNGRSDTGVLPLKLFETLACGVPVIVTDFPGQADIVSKEQCGLVINKDSPLALAEAISYLAANLELAKEMGQRGHDLVVREYSWDQKAEETQEFILKTIKNIK